MNYGLKLSPIKADHHVLGGLGPDWPVINPDGHQYANNLLPTEYQNKNGLETDNCTNFGTNHALETFAQYMGFTDFPLDCSCRYTGVETNTQPGGNDPHQVIETIRTVCGEIPEKSLPFDDSITSWDEYYHPKPMTTDFVALGRALLDKYTIQHKWVFNGGAPDRPSLLKQALTIGTVCVSVYAWRRDATTGLYYKESGDVDEHWVELIDYVDGQYWVIRDQYDPLDKHLQWNFAFEAAKVYRILQNDPQARLTLIASILQKLISLYKQLTAS